VFESAVNVGIEEAPGHVAPRVNLSNLVQEASEEEVDVIFVA
jgi:hypothetical protein